MLSDGSILKYTTAPFSASRRDATLLLARLHNRFENVEATSEIRAVEARQTSDVVTTQHIGIIMQYAFLILSRLHCVRIGSKVARGYLKYPHCRGV